MASEWFYGLLVLLLGVGLMYGVYHAFTSAGTLRQASTSLPSSQYSSSPSQTVSSPPECEEKADAACTLSNGCSGNKICYNGKWTGCNAPLQACKPGSKIGCAFTDETGCGVGEKTCNACGTGWSGCS